MLTLERKDLITELLTNITKDVLAHVEKMPDSWNGVELRQYIADTARAYCTPKMKGYRKKCYMNTISVQGL